MSIAIIFNNKDPKPWVEKLQVELPLEKVEIYPDVEDLNRVDFALCWKPAKNVLNEFPNLLAIQSVGASAEHILRTQEIKEGIPVARIVDENLSSDMWEFLLGVVLKRMKNFDYFKNQQNNKIWNHKKYQSVGETTVTIMGLGEIGGYVAKKFCELGFKVNGWSSSRKVLGDVKSFAGMEELGKCLKTTDYLINLLPLTNATENILNSTNLSSLKEGSFLINVGRGEHIVESDLISFLDNNHLSGALLDVFREEPLPKSHPFWEHPKIKITPHVASLTNVGSAVNQIVENYQNLMRGKGLNNLVSLEKGY